MFLDFLQVTIVFAIGLLIANIVALAITRKMKRFIFSTIIELIFLGGFLYMVLPAKNLSTLIGLNLFLGLIATALNFLIYGYVVDHVKVFSAHAQQGTTFRSNTPFLKKYVKMVGVFGGLLLVLIIASSVTRITSIRSVYKTMPLKIEEKSELLTSTKDMPIAIAPDTAKRKMQQKFSVIPNSNMYQLDGITAQVVNGKYVYVATVEFTGFWKWLKNRDVPGYFIISATDISAQPEFIEKPLKYTPSAFFNYDAGRKIYAAFPTYASTGRINLEIDEKGTPFYVQTLYKEYGISGRMHFNEFKTAVLNAKTGEVNLYDSAKTPKFVDAPITSAAANEMNEYFGRYENGWWNQTMFGSKQNVKRPTENGIYSAGKITPMIDTKGQLTYFTDFTSSNSDQDSALGYSLINARTGQLTYYRDSKSGIMDSDGAISIADKIYPEKKWNAEMPILYNIDGTPTWIISLLDSKGIFKKYVYIDAVDNDIVVDADSAQEALDDYRNELVTKGSNNHSTDPATLKEITGEIYRVATVTQDDTTVVSFVLKGRGTVFHISALNQPDAIFLQAGDKVSFKANILDKAKSATIDEMEILGFNQ
ncbi:MAG: DNA-binding protein [Lactobacillales bacterium]|jgi:hypothetical protein|nr:DNA-binding protein [Lactobacillales bacterium]